LLLVSPTSSSVSHCKNFLTVKHYFIEYRYLHICNSVNYNSADLIISSMFKFIQLFVGILSICNAFQGNRCFSKVAMKSSLRMSNDDNNIPKLARDSMKQPMQRGLQGAFALSGALMASLIKPAPAFAFGKLEDANTKLGLYELPPIIFVPPGFTPLVSEFGRGNIREKMVNPLLIQFCHPQLWVEAVTSYNLNGEAGTISANDYIKGDSAFFYFRPLAEGQVLSVTSKDLIKEFILKSLSQKGDPVETFKIVSIKQGNKGVDGQVILYHSRHNC
jgi:hypothetical protein